MARLLRTVAAVTAIVAVVGAGLTGCAGGSPNPQGVVTKLVDASGKVNNFTADITSAITLESVGGTNANKLSMTLTGNSTVDITHDRSHTQLTVTTTAAGQQSDVSDIELYAADQWQYLKFPMGEGAPTWIKIGRAGDILAKTSQVAQETDLLKTATKVTALADETVNGVACNVLQAKPDVQKLLTLLLGQAQTHYTLGLQDSDFSDFDFSKVVKSVQIKEWIAKDTGRLVKAQGDISIQLAPADVGAASTDFTSLNVDMTMTITFSNYNAQVNIQVPADALSAPEMASATTPPPATTTTPSK